MQSAKAQPSGRCQRANAAQDPGLERRPKVKTVIVCGGERTCILSDWTLLASKSYKTDPLNHISPYEYATRRGHLIGRDRTQTLEIRSSRPGGTRPQILQPPRTSGHAIQQTARGNRNPFRCQPHTAEPHCEPSQAPTAPRASEGASAGPQTCLGQEARGSAYWAQTQPSPLPATACSRRPFPHRYPAHCRGQLREKQARPPLTAAVCAHRALLWASPWPPPGGACSPRPLPSPWPAPPLPTAPAPSLAARLPTRAGPSHPTETLKVQTWVRTRQKRCSLR